VIYKNTKDDISVIQNPKSGEIYLTVPAGIAMFHQMHCLQRIRDAIVQVDPGMHTPHCLNLLCQAVLCASDTTLNALNLAHGTDGLGVVHVCRDWQKVYDFFEENQKWETRQGLCDMVAAAQANNDLAQLVSCIWELKPDTSGVKHTHETAPQPMETLRKFRPRSQ
jgi:hypothetical protein